MRSAATDPADTTNIADSAISNKTHPSRRLSISKYQLVNLLSSFRVSLNITTPPRHIFYANFNKTNASPENKIDMIKNRSTILVSGQPSSSK